MKDNSSGIGIFGGSFDPIHLGHLRLVETIQNVVQLNEIKMLFSPRPSHKACSSISENHRWRMLCLACQGKEGLIPEPLEKKRPGVSFAIHTLEYFSEILDNVNLCWIIGSDAFSGLNSWYRWEELFQFCNFIVVERPGYKEMLNGGLLQVCRKKFVDEIDNRQNGQIYRVAAPMLNVSSTQIRARLKAGLAVDSLLPVAVTDYINQHQLYSHGIRR